MGIAGSYRYDYTKFKYKTKQTRDNDAQIENKPPINLTYSHYDPNPHIIFLPSTKIACE